VRLRVAGREAYAYTGTRPLEASLPTVVFVHGAGNDHSVWLLQSRYFAHHGMNALALDLPGHGRSEGPALASVEALADWIVATLDAAGVRKASLVGHSLGALAVLSCAARHTSRVSKIALLGPAVPMEVSEALLAAAKANDHVAYELVNGWATSPGKQLGGNTVPGQWLLGVSMRLMERNAPGVCPALVLLAARDLMAPPRAAKTLIGALADVRTATLPDTGHAMMVEQPDAVLDQLRAFL
jgi:pimeloyl-ACP methyl ester carboxylesterase